jgi:hypothetical protein
MPLTHVNRRRDTYYLHAGKTKTGKARYWFTKSADGDLVESIPDGYEVYENPDAQVFLRKIVRQLVPPAEVAVVADGLKRYAPGQNCILDLQGKHIVIYHAESVNLKIEGFRFGSLELPTIYQRYMKFMRFTLLDQKDRTFGVQRWCFRGSIDGWIDLWASGRAGTLSDLVKTFCPHIGQESFFELM